MEPFSFPGIWAQMDRIHPTCNSPLICLVSYGILMLMVEESKRLSVSVIGYPEECSGQS